MKVLIFTALKPDKDNRNGPTALIWEYINLLESLGSDVKVYIHKSNHNINKLGFFFQKKKLPDDFDLIIVYPFNLFFALKSEDRTKAYVVGPDSPSLLFSRMFKNSYSIPLRLKSLILKNWFTLKESILLKQARKFLVVGRNDLRWLLKRYPWTKNCVYVTHPILTSIVDQISSRKLNSENSSDTLSLVFSGDMSPKYTGKYIPEIAHALSLTSYRILIVGSKNRWIYELFLSYGREDINFIDWVENYTDVCNPLLHIHIVPLLCGAGTKNRTLSACATGVPLITTFVGYENIMYVKPDSQVFLFNHVDELISILESIKFSKKVCDTSHYIARVNSRFRAELLSALEISV